MSKKRSLKTAAAVMAVFVALAVGVTGAAGQTPAPATPPFNGTVPVIVGVSAQLPPGPVQPLRTTVSWTGVGDLSASYEIERSATNSTGTRDFQRLATVPGNAPAARGLFSYTEPDRSFALVVCYRVRAVRGTLASAYSAEYCLATPPRDGPGIEPAPSAPSAPVAGNSLPVRNGREWVASLGLILFGIALAALGVRSAPIAERRRRR